MLLFVGLSSRSRKQGVEANGYSNTYVAPALRAPARTGWFFSSTSFALRYIRAWRLDAACESGSATPAAEAAHTCTKSRRFMPPFYSGDRRLLQWFRG